MSVIWRRKDVWYVKNEKMRDEVRELIELAEEYITSPEQLLEFGEILNEYCFVSTFNKRTYKGECELLQKLSDILYCNYLYSYNHNNIRKNIIFPDDVVFSLPGYHQGEIVDFVLFRNGCVMKITTKKINKQVISHKDILLSVPNIFNFYCGEKFPSYVDVSDYNYSYCGDEGIFYLIFSFKLFLKNLDEFFRLTKLHLKFVLEE